MSGKTKIEWADKVWNPITGCTKISPGCQNCYAERMAKRLAGRCGYPADEPFRVTLHPDRLDQPLRWTKPRKIFVCSMGDLFHDDVPFEFISSQIFARMWLAEWHTFLILTKRPERMREFICEYLPGFISDNEPSKNIWLGVTAENQEQADKRIPILLQTPAAVRFVSVEPMLGPVSLRWLRAWNGEALNPNLRDTDEYDGLRCLNWVICGGESGPGARPMQVGWAQDLKDQCQAAGVPFFLKQATVNGKLVKMPELDGKVWCEVPHVANK